MNGTKKRGAKGQPNNIDVHVGGRLKLRRKLEGLSLEKLAEAVGVTYQQVQKYERGKNRMSACRLLQFASVLRVPVSFFFDDMPLGAGKGIPGLADRKSGSLEENLARSETLELVRAYYKIGDPGVRLRVFALTKALCRIGSENGKTK